MSKVLDIWPGEDEEKDILRCLLRLALGQEDEIKNIKEVQISCCDHGLTSFTESMVSDIVQTFRHISLKGIVWDRLVVSGLADQDEPHFQSLLSQICKLELFREISLNQDYYGRRGEVTERTARDVSDAMKNNTKLEKLSIQVAVLSPIVASVLCEGLKTENQNLTELQFFEFGFDEVSSDQPSAADAVSHLVTGLQNNKTLKRFSFSGCIVSDCESSRIITALEGHPTLEHFEFEPRFITFLETPDPLITRQSKKKITESLRGVLSLQTCKVCSLKVTGKVVDFNLLLEGLEQNKSLKRLSLIDCDLDDGDLLKLLINLWKIQNLTHLDLSRNVISKFPFLDPSVFVSVRRIRLRSLNLEYNPIMKEGKENNNQSALLRLLMNAPQLGHVADPRTTETSDLITPLIRHYLDWNRCGRILPTDHETALPLSMWPLVFARANTILQEDRIQRPEGDSPDRRPNVIYQLFHGFLFLHLGVLSNSHFFNCDTSEPQEKRQKLI
jgi:hypothetical protein